MTNTNWDEEALAESLHRLSNAERFTNYFKAPLVEIMNPLLSGGDVPPLEAIDVMMVLIFIHINLLGYLHSGKDKTSDAVAFLRKYLGMVDPKYKEVGGLLYDLLRHGWIHRFVPKRLKLNNEMILDFLYTNNVNREQHLIMVEIQGAKKLQISVSLLYKDLLSAIDLFADDIRHNQDLSDVFQKAFEMRRNPEEESNLRSKYNRDLNFIYHLLE